ncbi:RTA1 like protein-domain-containing protein [Clohesyomyces aquaticus]|uniref:RTA1 like protein-domain-containing protein n=1 Tax=Clohesyomyces aquaticus TaxID=1231657 RepID=A0A1Y1YCN4_9PLEO|nr:RTA1 like protein-domain-containing protein [Clohesyomyces aquaticus]
MGNTDLSEFRYYHYDPSIAAAVIFTLLFFTTTSLHMYQMIQTRTWFLIPFVIGGLFEFIGYIGRAVSSNESPNWTLGPYLVQTLFLLVAPALFAASIYMELGRIVLVVDGESHIWIKKRWLTKIFVCGDILSFLMQGSGGGLQAGGTQGLLDLGAHVVVGGLFVQILFFGVFIVVSFAFDISMRRVPTLKARSNHIWRKHLNTLYGASVLIMIRSIVRVVEYLQGFDGYLLGHELYLYVFDALLMTAVMIVLSFVHPSEVCAHAKGGLAFKNGYKLYKVDDRILEGTD